MTIGPGDKTVVFTAAVKPSDRDAKSLWFAFRGNTLLVQKTDPISVPYLGRLEDIGVHPIRTKYLGELGGVPCVAAELEPIQEVPTGFVFARVDQVAASIDKSQLHVALIAHPILAWDRTHQYCGTCGSQTVDDVTDRVKRCTRCGAKFYPRIHPTVVVLIHDGPKILLVRTRHFPQSTFGLISGFVETGESLEECAIREVKEEVGLTVGQLEYQQSQPWPLPQQIMVGFRAKYINGQICLNKTELSEARWFSRDEMPSLLPPISVTRWMIDRWIKND